MVVDECGESWEEEEVKVEGWWVVLLFGDMYVSKVVIIEEYMEVEEEDGVDVVLRK